MQRYGKMFEISETLDSWKLHITLRGTLLVQIKRDLHLSFRKPNLRIF